MSAPRLTVVGSVNLDFVATGANLPAPGETVTGATLSRHPGGKGANQALAARRLGAEVALIGRVGGDAMAEEALALARADGVDISACRIDPDQPTGVALIAVSADGENQIVVCPGANLAVTPADLPSRIDGALVVQLELPVETVAEAAARATGLIIANLAPARAVPEALLSRADIIVVNETEAAFYGDALLRTGGDLVLTLGARGAELWRAGERIVVAAPPPVTVIDTTGAGDAFVGALAVARLDGCDDQDALAFACAAGALAASRAGAQPSLPTGAELDAVLTRIPKL